MSTNGWTGYAPATVVVTVSPDGTLTFDVDVADLMQTVEPVEGFDVDRDALARIARTLDSRGAAGWAFTAVVTPDQDCSHEHIVWSKSRDYCADCGATLCTFDQD